MKRNTMGVTSMKEYEDEGEEGIEYSSTPHYTHNRSHEDVPSFGTEKGIETGLITREPMRDNKNSGRYS